MVYVSTAGMFCFMIGLSFLLGIVRLISPSLARKITLKMGEKTTMTQNPNFKYEDWGLTFSSMSMVRAACQHMWLSLGQEAFVGGAAPDTPVVTMQGERTTISRYMRGVF